VSVLDFLKRRKADDKAEMMLLTIAWVTARDGLSATDAAELRERILAASPLDFRFLNPGTFEIYFPGTSDGQSHATDIVHSLKSYAKENSISRFGIAMEQGECLATFSAEYGFLSWPLGKTVNRAIMAATVDADSNARR
jgi:hypothetical protein